MQTHELVNNQSDVAASADRDNLAKEGIGRFNETVTAALRNQDAAAWLLCGLKTLVSYLRVRK